MMRRALAAFAASLCAAATPLARTAGVEDVTMAVPAVGFPFTAGYVADGLGLWEKHGLRVKTIVDRRYRLDQCGDLRQRRLRARFPDCR